MCMLIAKPAGISIPHDILRHCNDRNPHGIGLAWTGVDGIRLWKTHDPKDIDAAIAVADTLTGDDALIHFRWATHGSRTLPNVHPFLIGDGEQMAMAHNGVISISTYEDLSDTRAFATHVLGQLRDGWYKDPICFQQIERLLNGDRMALLHAVDGLIVLNSSKFTKHEGALYSNAMFRPFGDSPYRESMAVTRYSDDSMKSYERWLAARAKRDEEYAAERAAARAERTYTKKTKRERRAERRKAEAASPRITNTKELSAALDDSDLPADFGDDLDLLAKNGLDAVIGYYVFSTPTSKGRMFCAKCVPEALATPELSTDITVSDCVCASLLEECAKCNASMLSVARKVAATLIGALTHEDDSPRTTGEALILTPEDARGEVERHAVASIIPAGTSSMSLGGELVSVTPLTEDVRLH